MATTWRCHRTRNKITCRHLNRGVSKKCERCGALRPKRRRPAHFAALDYTYEDYVRINGGEFCGICERTPTQRRLDRDHDHATGLPRGLLCWRCNSQLKAWMTIDWLRRAIRYLERTTKI